MAKHHGDAGMSSAFIYSDDFRGYSFSPDRPLTNCASHLRMIYYKGRFHLSSQIISPRMATDEEIAYVHTEEYINAVKRAGEGKLEKSIAMTYGLGTEDTPMFPNMHEASALLVGGTLTAVDAVLSGKVKHALNLGGGLHHGFRGKASGFCIYNDSSIAMKYIQKKYGLRVLYIDTDAHHGDGVQWSFYDDLTYAPFHCMKLVAIYSWNWRCKRTWTR